MISKKFFSVAAAVFCAVAALSGCVAPDTSPQAETAATASAIAATPVTVPIPLFASLPYNNPDLVNLSPTPPNWGFYAMAATPNTIDGGVDLYVPLNVPVGSSITQIKARVRSGHFNGCQLYVWRQTDLFTVDPVPLGQSNNLANNTGPATLTVDLNVTTQSLVHYFMTMHPTGVVDIACYMAAAEITYTPAG